MRRRKSCRPERSAPRPDAGDDAVTVGTDEVCGDGVLVAMRGRSSAQSRYAIGSSERKCHRKG